MPHDFWMSQALELAQYAESMGEVPIGAVVVYENEIVGKGYNQPILTKDPTAHAEIVAMREAAKTLGNYRLINTNLYVTLEPCAMCAGAMVHARIKNLIFGTTDPRAGAVTSVFNILDEKTLNHKVIWQGGVLAEESSRLLKSFFQRKR